MAEKKSTPNTQLHQNERTHRVRQGESWGGEWRYSHAIIDDHGNVLSLNDVAALHTVAKVKD